MPNQSNQTQPTSCPAPKEGSFRTTIGGQALIEGAARRSRPSWCATKTAA